ncbi:TRAP transporter substrate-binding protein [Desulfovibrio sp. OttesenSCG-928-G15]|nr:TRAP transporter substrate-binding protein [Desulfovibrio sp. OttesenSCG-928-G15]
MKRLLFATFLLPALLFAVTANAAEFKKMTIRAATANPESSLHVQAINKFKEIVEKESGGAISVQTFYGGSMGDEQANVKQLRTEELHLTVVACGNLTPFSARASLFILPYLFPNLEDAYKMFGNTEFMTKQADVIAQQSGARPLSWLVGGYRVLTNSKKAVTSIADLQGLKIRVPAVEIQLDAFRSWGVEPHPLAWTETFNGLQQGVVDGQENPHGVNRDQKFWEVQKYISDLHYMLWVGPMLVSEKWYRKLDPATKELMDKACAEAAKYEWKWSEEDVNKALEECKTHGMQVDALTDETVWIEKARGIWPKYSGKLGGQDVVDDALKAIQ